MRKNTLFYIGTIALMLSVLLFFNKGYRALSGYAELVNQQNTVYSIFKNISHSISKKQELFPKDNRSIKQNIDALKSIVVDSVNMRIVSSLDTNSINKFPATAVSLINAGINRTAFLIDYRKKQMHDEIGFLRVGMIVFIAISFLLFVFMNSDLARQKGKIRKKEKELETVFSRISDSVISVDNQWRCTFLNDAALATNPMGREAVLGKVIWHLYPGLRDTPFWDKFHEAMYTQKVGEMEAYYKPMRLWLYVKFYPSEDGLTVFYRDITKNVSDRSKLEQSLKEITDYKYALDESSIVTITDQKGMILYANKNFCHISKYDYEELIGSDHRIINSGYHNKHFIRNLWITIGNGKIWRGELRNKARDGSIYWVDSTIVPFLDENNVPYQFLAIASDITERKKLEEEQAIFSSIVNSSDDAIFSRKLDGTITTWNKGAEKIYGYSPEEIISKNNSLLIPAHLVYEEETILKKLLDEEPIEHYETERITKNGRIINVSITMSPIRDLFGKIIGVSKISRDITYNKAMEERIRSQNEELTGILERITDGFLMLDNDFRYVFVNREVGKMVSREPASLIGKVVWNEFPEAVGSPTYKAFIKARDTRQYVNNIDYYPPLDLWQENRIYPGPNGLSVFIRDISEQKRAEEKIKKSEKIYKTIASGIPGSLICLLDNDYRYILIEGDLLLKIGYSKDALLGYKMAEVLPEERYMQLLPDLQKVFRGETFIHDIKRGEYHLLTRYVPLKDEHNKVYAAMIVSIDITELKRAEQHIVDLNVGLEEKISERTAQLEAVNKELEAFTYSVSHDLRAPLRAVNGYAKMLEEDYRNKIDEEGQRLLTVIKSNATRMGLLIDELLQFSKLGRKPLSKTMIDMNKLVRFAIADVNAGMNVKANINVSNLHPVMGDQALMSHVLVNLISNAVKYSSMNENSAIQIETEKKDGEFIFCVKDNGVGFDMRYVDKLFGVFQRLHSQDEFPGTGVGLAIVQRIINKHGGSVWAKGEINKGAEFYFSIPDVKINDTYDKQI